MTAWSYVDRMNFSFLGCPDLVDDLAPLVAELPRALEELRTTKGALHEEPDARSTIRTVLAPAGWALRTAVGAGARQAMPPPALDRLLEGRMVDAARIAGAPSSSTSRARPRTRPSVVLLHALGCTAHLAWALGARASSRRPTA